MKRVITISIVSEFDDEDKPTEEEDRLEMEQMLHDNGIFEYQIDIDDRP